MSAIHNKIEIYQSGSLSHTLTNVCDELTFKNVLNNVGTFSVALPAKNGNTYQYYDIVKGDQIKIYLSTTGTFSSTPNFMGKIYQIAGSVSKEEGFLRVLSGKDNGEILQRKLLHAYYFDDVDADDVVAKVISDLSLGSDIDVETQNVSIPVETETYLDIMSRVSDYWIDATHKVNKDFYVDIGDAGHFNGHLIWKARPLRSVGTETISTSNTNLVAYKVWRSLEEKNNIRVLGDNSKCLPSDFYTDDQDNYSDATTDWTLEAGTTLTADANHTRGDYSIKGHRDASDGDNELVFYRAITASTPLGIGRDKFKRVSFKWYVAQNTINEVIFLCPDYSNYVGFYLLGPEDTWNSTSRTFKKLSDFPISVGSPDLDDCHYIGFIAASLVDIAIDLYIDDLVIDDCSFSGTASSGAADKDLEVTDTQLKSDAECASRANTLLYQYSSIPARVDVVLTGNTNVLIGDRVPVTIAQENIAAANYDVLSVTQTVSKGGFVTSASMVETGDIRYLPPMNERESTLKAINNLRAVAKGVEMAGFK